MLQKIGKKITIQGTDVAGFDKSKVKCFNCHKMGHFAKECRAPRSQDRGRRENYKQEEEDGDDEKSEEDSIKYLTSGGDDDADDDGDDLSEDDADDKDEEESSDSEEEHLAPIVPAPALHKVERLLAIPTPPLSPVSPTSYPLPPFLMSLPIFTPLPTSSFSLPLSLPSTSGSESIPEADIPLWKRARFTTPTGGYEVGESSVAAAARQTRHALTIADRRRTDDRLIGRLRRERRYFRTLSTTYAQEVASCSWSFVFAVPGMMTHLVTSLTSDSANSYVMQGASCTQRKVSMVLFVLPSVLLLVVIIVMVMIVVVILVVIVVAIVGVVVVVVGNKLLLVIVGSFSCYWSSTCPGVPISIVSIFHVSSLCFQSSNNDISNQLPDGSLSHNWCCGC
nr:hypothetical protein [Tanacetum cinerariifolium]